MSTYLARLAARALGQGGDLLPRRPSRFEGGGGLVPGTEGLTPAPEALTPAPQTLTPALSRERGRGAEGSVGLERERRVGVAGELGPVRVEMGRSRRAPDESEPGGGALSRSRERVGVRAVPETLTPAPLPLERARGSEKVEASREPGPVRVQVLREGSAPEENEPGGGALSRSRERVGVRAVPETLTPAPLPLERARGSEKVEASRELGPVRVQALREGSAPEADEPVGGGLSRSRERVGVRVLAEPAPAERPGVRSLRPVAAAALPRREADAPAGPPIVNVTIERVEVEALGRPAPPPRPAPAGPARLGLADYLASRSARPR